MFWPILCLLCQLPTASTAIICTDCEDTLPHLQIQDAQETILFSYESPISDLIMQLKFSENLSIAHWFSQQFIQKLKSRTRVLPQIILPVPLHYNRLRERGFNQALEIAKPVARYFQSPVDTKTCVRIKDTKPQSSLEAAKRKTNVNNAFALSYTPAAKHIALLDDVTTTGSTLSEITTLLQKAGVEKIERWCVAKTNHKSVAVPSNTSDAIIIDSDNVGCG